MPNKALQPIAARWAAPAELCDKLTASCALGQLIGGGCFAIALTGSAHAPPIKAIEPTSPPSLRECFRILSDWEASGSSAAVMCEKMIKALTIFFCLTIQLFGLLAFAAAETETLRYALCTNNIAQAKVASHGDDFFVIIKLSQLATNDFRTITAKNVGKRLTILLNDTIVTSAIIQDEIDSGTIQSSRMTEIAAKNLQQRILNSIEGQCGLIK